MERSQSVGVHHLFPLFCRHFHKRLDGYQYSGVVDQNIDRAESFHRSLGECVALILRGDVGFYIKGLASRLFLGAFSADRPDAAQAELARRLNEVEEVYRAGDAAHAQALLDDAYEDVLDRGGLEAAIGARSPRLKAEVEAKFAEIRGLMAARSPFETVHQAVESLRAELREAAELLQGGGGRPAAFVNAMVIIVREGFEAMLVITALVAYLLKAGHASKVRAVYQASGVALLASALTAVVVQTLFRANPSHEAVLEGATMLLATTVLFYMSYWLTSKAEADRWQRYLRDRIQASLHSGSLVALWSAAFLAVYREGAETILFYRALLAGASAGEVSAIVLGLAAGALGLVLLFYVLRSGAVRIPIRAFFTVTSVLLYYLAFVFAGKGIRELQESGLVRATALSWLPTWEPLGLYPTWESLGLQLVLVAAAAFSLVYLFLLRRRPDGATAA